MDFVGICSSSANPVGENDNSQENNMMQKDIGSIYVFDDGETAPSPVDFVTIDIRSNDVFDEGETAPSPVDFVTIEVETEVPETPEAQVLCYSPLTSPLQCETPRKRRFRTKAKMKPRKIDFDKQEEYQ